MRVMRVAYCFFREAPQYFGDFNTCKNKIKPYFTVF
jgi:hypothetical protein